MARRILPRPVRSNHSSAPYAPSFSHQPTVKAKILTCKALHDPTRFPLPLISCPPPPSLCCSHSVPLAVLRMCQTRPHLASLPWLFPLPGKLLPGLPAGLTPSSHSGLCFNAILSLTRTPCHSYPPYSSSFVLIALITNMLHIYLFIVTWLILYNILMFSKRRETLLTAVSLVP